MRFFRAAKNIYRYSIGASVGFLIGALACYDGESPEKATISIDIKHNQVFTPQESATEGENELKNALDAATPNIREIRNSQINRRPVTSYDTSSRLERLNDNLESLSEHVNPSRKEIFSGETQYFPIIERAAKNYKVPSDLLKALVATESSYDQNAISPAGAKGLTQLMPLTAKEVGVENPLDPEQSIDGGAMYLSRMFKLFNDERLALAAYNCGPGRVRRLQKKASSEKFDDIFEMLPKETKNYVTKVISLKARYSRQN